MSHHRNPLNLIFILAISLFSAQALAGISVGSYIGKYCKQDCVQPLVLAKAVLRNAKALKLNPRLILAVIKTESKFRISAKNGSSRGLMQVHLRYHQSNFNPAMRTTLMTTSEWGASSSTIALNATRCAIKP